MSYLRGSNREIVADEDGQVLAGRYVMGDRLGSGGTSAVYLAEDRRLQRPVAIKWLRPGPENAGTAARRFRREARITASLNHANTVQLYDAVVDGADLFLVMEYVPGSTLAERMRERDLAAAEVLPILRDIGGALDDAHRRGVVHRDVKPANILLDSRTGRAKLADLGIASTVHGTRMTTAGAVLGTPAYMAPEVLDGRAATPAADIYSLAAVAFEALSGHPLREGDAPIAIAVQAVTAPARDLLDVQPAAPAAAAEALSHALARDPGQRPASCRDLIDALAAAYEPGAETPDLPVPAVGAGEEAPGLPVPAIGAGEEAPGLPIPAVGAAEEAGGVPVPAGEDVRDEPARPWWPRRRWRWLAAVLGVCAVAVAAVLSVTLAPSGSHSPAHRPGATPGKASPPAATGPASTPGAGARSPAASHTAAPPPPAQASSGPARSPVAAVEQFYLRAARHDYPDAWALAAPSYRQELQGYDSFRATFADVVAIHFRDAHVVGADGGNATVAISSVSQHTNRTEQCAGTVMTHAVAPDDWQITQINIHC